MKKASRDLLRESFLNEVRSLLLAKQDTFVANGKPRQNVDPAALAELHNSTHAAIDRMRAIGPSILPGADDAFFDDIEDHIKRIFEEIYLQPLKPRGEAN